MVDVGDMWDDEEDNESVRAMTFPKCKKPPVDVREYVNGLVVSDHALIEAMARVICDNSHKPHLTFHDIARTCLAVARPIIEAQERERCARICEGDFDSEMKSYGAYFAGAIREGDGR